MISSLIGLIYNFFDNKGIPLIKAERTLEWENESPDSTRESVIIPDDFSSPKAINIEQAYKLFNNGIQFIDGRPVEEFAGGHIKGAVNIPYYGSEKFEHVLNTLDKNEIVVTYCSGSDCDISILLADELFDKGFKKVLIFFGGWNDWQSKGYPIEK